MSSITPLRSLTLNTVVVVKLACTPAAPLAARPAAHRDGVAAAQNLCTPHAACARSPAEAGFDAMA